MFFNANTLESHLSILKNAVDVKVIQSMLKPKDSRFETVDDVLEYAVTNFSKIDDIFKFVSEQLGIYLEFDKETLIDMVNTSYEDVRSKMLNIQLFETVPFWWIVFPDKDRLLEYLRKKIYTAVSDMTKEMILEDEENKSEIDFTLPHLVSAVRSGIGTPNINNPNEILNFLERAIYGKYVDSEADIGHITPYTDIQTPLENWNDALLKDIAETVKTSPELNDTLFKLGETLKKMKKTIEPSKSPTLQELNKHVNKALKNIDEHFKKLNEIRNKEPTAQDGMEIYQNLYELNNELNTINDILNELNKFAPELQNRIKSQFAPAMQNLANDITNQLSQFQMQAQQTPATQQPSTPNLGALMDNINQLNQNLNNMQQQNLPTEMPNTDPFQALVEMIKNTVTGISKLSEAKRKIIEAELLVVIDSLLKNDLPTEVRKSLLSIRKEVVRNE